nr:PA2169 family four-helix-bundle protein [Pseudomonadota bacterium]
SLSWPQAKHASRAAWSRVDNTMRSGGAAAAVGAAQSAGNNSGDNDDVIDALQDLAECAKDGEYGFRACAEQAKRQDLKSTFLQRADDCRGAAQELNDQIRSLGGSSEDSGSAAGALHRGWVSVKATLSTYDDKAVLEEAERGEDNAKARYTKALKQPLPASIKLIVERQMQGLQRNHDQIKMLRDQLRAAS